MGQREVVVGNPVAIGFRSGGVHGENLWSLEVYPS